MTPAQLKHLVAIHHIAQGGEPDGRTDPKGEQRVHVTADKAPAILSTLAAQRLRR